MNLIPPTLLYETKEILSRRDLAREEKSFLKSLEDREGWGNER